MKRLGLFAVAIAALGMFTFASADAQSKPTGEVILTISGDLADEANQDGVGFDLQMLQMLPEIKFTTTTQWTEGEVEFTGVSLQLLLEHVGATGGTVSAIALNDYKIEIPTASLEGEAPIVAYLMNGETMSRRGKGPLWIVYPYDTDEKYRTETTYSRSIWQLDRLISAD